MKRTVEQYARALYEATKDLSGKDISIAVQNFVNLLARDHAVSKAAAIIAAFEKTARKADGGFEIQVTSAHELSDATVKKIAAVFGEKVEAVQQVDESLLGGVQVKTDDTIFDASLSTQLKTLQSQLS